MSTQQAHDADDVNQAVADLRRDVADLQTRISILEGDTPADGRITTTRAAQLLGLAHRSSVIRLAKTGHLEGWQHPETGRWRITLTSIHRHLNTHP